MSWNLFDSTKYYVIYEIAFNILLFIRIWEFEQFIYFDMFATFFKILFWVHYVPKHMMITEILTQIVYLKKTAQIYQINC